MIQQLEIGARCLAGASAALVVVSPFGARAQADHHNGNGHHNRTTVSYRSPTHNRGYQHTSNSNSGGMNNTQNALCRHSYICHVTQNITIVRPEKTEPAPPSEPAAPAEVAPPPEPVRPAGPFLYVGPEGIMLSGGEPRSALFPFSFGFFQ